MTRLTNRQKELLQEDKYNLVDTIVILEHQLENTIEEIRFLKNEMLLISESRNKKHNDVIIADIEKQLDQAWEGNISSQNFVDTVTKIFTGDYYDKSN